MLLVIFALLGPVGCCFFDPTLVQCCSTTADCSDKMVGDDTGETGCQDTAGC